MHDPRVPETLEGWSVLHQMFRIRWPEWRVRPQDLRERLAAEAAEALTAMRGNGHGTTVDLTATTNLHSVEEFRNLVLKSANGAIVRLGNVANVTLGSENYDTAVGFDGESAVYIGIKVAPTANLLTVIDGVRKVFPAVEQQLPEGLSGRIVYDATKYVNSSIHEVVTTLLTAVGDPNDPE